MTNRQIGPKQENKQNKQPLIHFFLFRPEEEKQFYISIFSKYEIEE